jgi:hypothetical protein
MICGEWSRRATLAETTGRDAQAVPPSPTSALRSAKLSDSLAPLTQRLTPPVLATCGPLWPRKRRRKRGRRNRLRSTHDALWGCRGMHAENRVAGRLVPNRSGLAAARLPECDGTGRGSNGATRNGDDTTTRVVQTRRYCDDMRERIEWGTLRTSAGLRALRRSRSQRERSWRSRWRGSDGPQL